MKEYQKAFPSAQFELRDDYEVKNKHKRKDTLMFFMQRGVSYFNMDSVYLNWYEGRRVTCMTRLTSPCWLLTTALMIGSFFTILLSQSRLHGAIESQ